MRELPEKSIIRKYFFSILAEHDQHGRDKDDEKYKYIVSKHFLSPSQSFAITAAVSALRMISAFFLAAIFAPSVK